MLGAMVIDEKGEVLPLGSPRLSALPKRGEAQVDIVAYAVRNLGYVLLRHQGRLVRVEMRPALVRPATLIGLNYALLDLKPQRILLSRLTPDGAAHDLFDDVAEFAATVERAIGDDGFKRHLPDFALSSRSLQQLSGARYARFAPAMALWAGTRGRLPGDLLAALGGHGLKGRIALLRNPTGTTRLVYEHVGSGYSFLGKACLPLTLLGRDIERLPDEAYGDCAAGSYYGCLADGAPRLETVSAVMRRGDGQRLWSYYDRVLLPWRRGDGTRYVLGVSEVRRRMLAA